MIIRELVIRLSKNYHIATNAFNQTSSRKFGNNWTDRRNPRFQGRGRFSNQDQQQGSQDWPQTEVFESF